MKNITCPTGRIDTVQVAKSIDEVREIIVTFENFTDAHPKTIRRFARKTKAKLVELKLKKGGK